MELERSDVWRRHQLAAVERMQKDLSRYTHPVIRVLGLSGMAYLASWAAVMVLGPDDGVSMPVSLVAGFSAAVVVLGAPALVLAVGVERSLRGRLESAEAVAPSPPFGRCVRSTHWEVPPRSPTMRRLGVS